MPPTTRHLLKQLRDAAERLHTGDEAALFVFVSTLSCLRDRLPEQIPGWRLCWERDARPPRFRLGTPAASGESLPATKIVEIVTAGLALYPDTMPDESDDGADKVEGSRLS